MGTKRNRTVSRLARLATDFWGYFHLVSYAATHLRGLKRIPTRTVLYRQIYFTGIETIGRVVVIGLLIGIVLITQVASFGWCSPKTTGRILVSTVVRELGGVLTAIIVIARSGGAVAAELGAVKITRDAEHLRVLGIDPMQYLILPRLLGITVAVFVLSVYFQIAALFGGVVFSSVLAGLPFTQYMNAVVAAIHPLDVAVSLGKSMVFGLIIATVACYQGFNVKVSITEIPQASIRAVMQSLLLVFLFDGIITLVAFL